MGGRRHPLAPSIDARHNWTLRLQSQNAVLSALRTDRRQHARTRFSSVLQCLLERRRKGLVCCDQLLAFHRRIGWDDRWARLAVVSALGAHFVPTPTLGAELRSLSG